MSDALVVKINVGDQYWVITKDGIPYIKRNTSIEPLFMGVWTLSGAITDAMNFIFNVQPLDTTVQPL